VFLKIDKDGDNLVSPAELQSWMRQIQRQSMDAERDKQWLEMNSKDPNLLTWDEYVQHTYKNNKGRYCIIVVLKVTCLYTVKLLLNAGSRIIAGSLINAGVLRPVF